MPRRCRRRVGLLRCGALQDLEGRSSHRPRRGSKSGAQRVDARGLQPLLGPALQLTARGLLQGGEQVGELRVPEGEVLEVLPQPGHEGVEAHPRHELLEHRGALGVGDHVEVDLDGVQVDVVGRDRVRARQLVGAVAGLLARVGEAGPRVGELGGLGLAPVAGPLGERLVEPEVVPPLHGHQVAEPHVRHLVGDHRARGTRRTSAAGGCGGGTRRAASRSRRSPSRPCCTPARRAGRTSRTGRGSRTAPRRTRSSAW